MINAEAPLYGRFLVETLKPYIDKHYRTKKDRKFTAVSGSSMGGLVSVYLALEYQDTFSKVVNLMKRYDNITFTQSSSFFYEVIEALSPKLFKEISKFISSGRWEYTGGYIEFDANIPSGESIVRHLTMGQRYYKEKFGKYADVVWLPDSFGFPVSLPQILKKSGFNRLLYFFLF